MRPWLDVRPLIPDITLCHELEDGTAGPRGLPGVFFGGRPRQSVTDWGWRT